jgi:hypothetical protein
MQTKQNNTDKTLTSDTYFLQVTFKVLSIVDSMAEGLLLLPQQRMVLVMLCSILTALLGYGGTDVAPSAEDGVGDVV